MSASELLILAGGFAALGGTLAEGSPMSAAVCFATAGWLLVRMLRRVNNLRDDPAPYRRRRRPF